jgi:Bardet-Biedl syndrome 5 protein
LPKEEIFSRYTGIWNLSAEQGNLGSFFVTNVRVVWFAQLSENFNVSIPWVQMRCVRIRDSKYGMALVIETSEHSGGYVLGFKIDGEQIEKIYNEINKLFQTFVENPNFGVECTFEEAEKNIEEVTIPRVEDDISVIQTGYEHT